MLQKPIQNTKHKLRLMQAVTTQMWVNVIDWLASWFSCISKVYNILSKDLLFIDRNSVVAYAISWDYPNPIGDFFRNWQNHHPWSATTCETNVQSKLSKWMQWKSNKKIYSKLKCMTKDNWDVSRTIICIFDACSYFFSPILWRIKRYKIYIWIKLID